MGGSEGGKGDDASEFGVRRRVRENEKGDALEEEEGNGVAASTSLIAAVDVGQW